MAPTAPVTPTAVAAPASPPAAAAPNANAAANVAAQSAAAPIAGALPPGLARYTQASRYGDLLFLSGQIGVDPRTGDFAGEAPVEQQTRQTMENIRAILETHGLTMANVVSVTVYVANINSLGAVDGAYAPFFKTALPARSVVEAQRLPRGALVEITVVAGR